MVRRRRDAEATRSRIVDAATKLFSERGLHGASAADIARAAGVTKSLIHHHFQDKGSLYEDVQDAAARAYQELMAGLLAGPMDTKAGVASAFRLALVSWYEHLLAHPREAQLLAWDALIDVPGSEVRQELALGAFRSLVARVQAAQDAGLIRADVDPRHVITAIEALVEHRFLLDRQSGRIEEGSSPGSENDLRYLEDVLGLLLAGVLV